MERLIEFTVIDAIDILLVAFVIYEMVRFVRGTRAYQMLLGLVVVLGTAMLANLFHLEALRWLAKGFKDIWLIAFVVVFQPEIRRALARIGRARLLRFFWGPPHIRTVDEVTKAALQMSKERIGGLVAIERRIGLGSYIEGGVRIDARISAELIRSIFFPGNPLHDGAIIIREDMIVSAGCILPLSEAPLPRGVGTRHRAAVGLSEETDAVCVVVSEETGTISVAVQGRLIRRLSGERLKVTLYDLLK